GCAATVYIKPDATPLSTQANHDFQKKRAEGMKNPITELEILDLAIQHSSAIHRRMVHHVLQFLFNTPEFSFESYEHKESTLFAPPPWLDKLPHGPKHAAKQFLLGSVNIGEASYEDNLRVLDEWLKQLGIDTEEKKRKIRVEKLVMWNPNHLTAMMDDVNNLVGPSAMGFAYSLPKRFFGTRKGHGIGQACMPRVYGKGVRTDISESVTSLRYTGKEIVLMMVRRNFMGL
ncbi:hypothetical protein MPER_01126, partial [Moniliophthora perniciosa FA553]